MNGCRVRQVVNHQRPARWWRETNQVLYLLLCHYLSTSMLSPSCRVFARQLGQRRLLSAGRWPARKCALVKSSIAIIGVSSAIAAAYFLLPDPSRSLPTHTEKLLSPSHFTPVTLVRSVQTSPDTKLFTLSVPPELIPQDSQQFAPIWSVFIKDDDIQVERPYTPLQGVDENGHMLFWIKKYDRGEVGRWLHSKQSGSSVEIRGPLKTWTWKDGTWDDIIMVTSPSTTELEPVSPIHFQDIRWHRDYPILSAVAQCLLHEKRV